MSSLACWVRKICNAIFLKASRNVPSWIFFEASQMFRIKSFGKLLEMIRIESSVWKDKYHERNDLVQDVQVNILKRKGLLHSS